MLNYDKLKQEHSRLADELALPDIYNDRERYQSVARRFSFLEKVIARVKEREKAAQEKVHLEEMITDACEEQEMKELARLELPRLEEAIASLDEQIEGMLFEGENEPDRDVIIEIRAAAGGEEAALFASSLFDMYSRYIEKHGWKKELLNFHDTEIGGAKEIVFSVKGQGCFAHLKFESGVHRVQRVPATESGGRIHTSTATVAVLMEPKNVELQIDPQDLKIDTFRASGAGGQHVNRTDSAVRMTHLPTGLVVVCQDERSQIKNREKALRVMRARLLDKMQRDQTSKISDARRFQIGSGERSEKIRTYNFPERRVTEHRINLTLYRLESILAGDLDEIISALIKEERKKMYEAKGLD
jgi:peptide chain release factor 1